MSRGIGGLSDIVVAGSPPTISIALLPFRRRVRVEALEKSVRRPDPCGLSHRENEVHGDIISTGPTALVQGGSWIYCVPEKK